MRSQSQHSYFSPAPAPARAPSIASKAVPSSLWWLVALAVGSSFYVAMEPAPTDLLFLVLFAVVLLKKGLRFPLDLNPVLAIGLLGFSAGSVLSLIASEVGTRAGFYLSVTAYLFIAWYMLVTLLANYGTPMWQLILRAFLVAAVLGALIGLIGHFSTVPQDYLGLRSAYAGRARGAFKDPNVYAPFLCAALLLVINQMVTRRVLSVVSIVLLCLFSLEILAAFSRGAYVSLAVSLFVYFALLLWVNPRSDRLVRSGAIIIVGSLIVVVLSIVFIRAAGMEDLLLERLQLQHYDTERFSTQSLALTTLSDSPLGVGPGQSEVLFPQSTHNLYVRIAIENGIISALFFLVFLAATFWISLQGAWRRGPHQDIYVCCIAILAGILVNSLVIDSLHWRHFFLFLAVPIGLDHYERWMRGPSVAARPLVRREPEYR
jgi:O-antigen ligase